MNSILPGGLWKYENPKKLPEMCLDRIEDWINFQNIFFVNLYERDLPFFSAVHSLSTLLFWFYFQQKQKNKFPNTRKKGRTWSAEEDEGGERSSTFNNIIMSVCLILLDCWQKREEAGKIS